MCDKASVKVWSKIQNPLRNIAGVAQKSVFFHIKKTKGQIPRKMFESQNTDNMCQGT